MVRTGLLFLLALADTASAKDWRAKTRAVIAEIGKTLVNTENANVALQAIGYSGPKALLLERQAWRFDRG